MRLLKCVIVCVIVCDCEQTAGSVSSLEGFSPGSHSGEMNHHGAAGRGAGGAGGLERRAGGYEKEEEDVQWEIPWVLIPITGPCAHSGYTSLGVISVFIKQSIPQMNTLEYRRTRKEKQSVQMCRVTGGS